MTDILKTGHRAGWALARSNPFMPQINFDAEDGTGSGDAGAAAAAAAKATADAATAKAAADKAAADAAALKKDDGLSDKEAALLKENMEKKTKLKEAEQKLKDAQALLDKFAGLDAEEAKALKIAKTEDEKKALEAKGEFDRLKKMMGEEHVKALDLMKATAKVNEDALTEARKLINDLTIGQAFTTSEYVTKDLMVPANKARTIYGQHFEIEDGRIVGFDKPRGEETRTKLVDGAGETMSFEAAMKKIIEADPDRDSLLRSKTKTGAAAKTDAELRKAIDGNTGLKGVAMIEASLNARKK